MASCCASSRRDGTEVSPLPAEASRTDPSEADSPATAEADGPDSRLLSELAAQAPEDLTMVGLAGGRFRMGSDDSLAYPEDGEGPVREVEVGSFAIAATTVTVAEFAAFVEATGHRTVAERLGDSLVFAGLLAPESRAASAAAAGAPWWRQVAGACWHRPEGRGSSAAGRADHPVTHVSRLDAEAYASWVGARVPTEAEWEFAARGGLDQQPYPWGAVREPGGRPRMNTFQGVFPDAPSAPVGTVPARAFDPNGYGLHNMTGNVWEWAAGAFGPDDDRGVLRGGSYMCHDSYCRRYRTSARTATTADTSLGHAGFRLAVDVA